MYIYIYINMYTYIYLYVYIYIYTYIYIACMGYTDTMTWNKHARAQTLVHLSPFSLSLSAYIPSRAPAQGTKSGSRTLHSSLSVQHA